MAAGSIPPAITSDTVWQASAVVLNNPTAVRIPGGLGVSRTQRDVISPSVPSLPQIKPGRSNGPPSNAPLAAPQFRIVPSDKTISMPST